MWSVNAHIWNDISKAAPLRTPFGRIMFGLDGDAMMGALVAIEDALRTDGVPPRLLVPYMTLGPMLWEHEAVEAYLGVPASFAAFNNITTVPDIDAAIYIARLEWGLDPDEERLLAMLLRAPPTVPWLAKVWARAKAARVGPATPPAVEAALEPDLAPEPPTATEAAAKTKAPRDRVVTAKAGDIATALRRQRPCVVTLKFNKRKSVLTFEESVYAAFSIGIPATGSLAGEPQIDAFKLATRAGTYRPDTPLELRALDGFVEVRRGKSFLKIERHDLGGVPVQRRAPPVNRRHKGKVEIAPEGRRLAPPKGHTWDFSAQVPFAEADHAPATAFVAPLNPATKLPKS